ncbi:MAG: hypothetical protein IT537_01895 [Hyphomicrobiales bacterium]|nr:hypothetical protein [Hyphomicrobiales bacterium]
MSDLTDKKRQDLARISKELGASHLSRRGLLDRLKGIGVGFGAAFLFGVKQSEARTDATATLKSTNPALNKILQEDASNDQTGAEGEDARIQTAYVRVFRRAFRRVFRRF